MQVVRHQAITDHRQTLDLYRWAQQIQVNHPLHVGGQNELPPIPTLRQVVRHIHPDHPSQSCRGQAQYQKTSPGFPIRGESRIREWRLYGSVRGAVSDDRPYRNPVS